MSCLIFDASATAETGSSVWHIKNKYYTAQVRIVIVETLEANDSSSSHANTAATGEDIDTRAVIYYGGDLGSDSTWETVSGSLEDWHKSMLDVINQEDDERIKMVVYKSLETVPDALTDQLKSWSLTHSAELVDLNETEEEVEESPFNTGNNRVVDALTAYVGWPPPPPLPTTSEAQEPEVDIPEEGGAPEEEEDPTFEQLFSQLSRFRESAESLPNNQRKAMAEELALAFYSAIGGGDSDSENDAAGDGSDSPLPQS